MGSRDGMDAETQAAYERLQILCMHLAVLHTESDAEVDRVSVERIPLQKDLKLLLDYVDHK